MPEPLVQLRDLVKEFPVKGGIFQRQVGTVNAVAGVDMDIHKGETIGLVGESGCGKTTLGRMLVRLLEPTSGTITFDAQDITHLMGTELKPFRKRVQIIFQDPFSSLDPRAQVGASIGEGVRLHGMTNKEERRAKVEDTLELVGLQPSYADRFPHEFSGGQRQRIGIARALALDPDFIVADEPVSALDVSIQAQVLNLLKELQSELGLTLLFIAHDLSMVRYVSDRMAVMYLGSLVEMGQANDVFFRPKHPYTEFLVASNPEPDPEEERKRPYTPIRGEIPSPVNIGAGCRFASRCPKVMDVCRSQTPEFIPLVDNETGNPRQVACHLYSA